MEDRLPPHDVEAEEAVLAAILVSQDAIHKVRPIITPRDFFREKNAWVYESALALNSRQEHIDQITLAHELERVGRLDGVGGSTYLSDLVRQLPTAVGVEFYARLIKQDSTYRQIANAAAEVSSLAFQAPADIDLVFSQIDRLFQGIRSEEEFKNFTHIADVLSRYLMTQEEREAAGEPTGEPIMSGFVDIDTLTGGFKPSDLVIVGARPSVGKSSFALSIARNAALEQNATVAFFSLEMSSSQLSARLLSAESGVDHTRLRTGENSENEANLVLNATSTLCDADIWFDDSASLNISDLYSRLSQLTIKHPIDLVIIDYLQLMRGDGNGRENRIQEISYISRMLKSIAREFGVPVIALSQLSRSIEQRDDKTPMLSDLRDSGSIEQDADVVMFLSRESMYISLEQWQMENPELPDSAFPRGTAQVIVAKHRNGPVGTVDLRFKEHLAKFEDWATA